jgi:hypothetical protein
MNILKAGDRVTIQWKDWHDLAREVDGTVILASQNGRSLMLGFEAILRGCVSMCPVLLGEDGVYRSIMDGEPVIITMKEAP